MKLTGLLDEDFQNYRKTSMFLSTSMCDGKCYRELGMSPELCQNYHLQSDSTKIMNVDDHRIIERYLANPITQAIVIGGLEPLMNQQEILNFVTMLRSSYHCEDDVVIYTGYNPEEVPNFVSEVGRYANILMKFGRYLPNRQSKFDPVLGVTLASDNQYGVRL